MWMLQIKIRQFKNQNRNKKIKIKLRTPMPIKNCVQTVIVIFYSNYSLLGDQVSFFHAFSRWENKFSFNMNTALLHYNKAKLFLKIFSQNSNLDDSDISLLVFPSRTDLKLHISVTTALVKDIINPYNCLLKKDNFPIKTSND